MYNIFNNIASWHVSCKLSVVIWGWESTFPHQTLNKTGETSHEKSYPSACHHRLYSI